MGNEGCCAANNERNEGKEMTVEDLVAKRQMARSHAPVHHEKNGLQESFKSTDRPAMKDDIACALIEKVDATLPDGSSYKGQWNGDKKEGHGILKYPDGAVYEGSYL